MENRGLLFIPDISGFTKFINETEISHSRLIIQELLELLINANNIGLEISEIEGDAILFYKFGDPPELEAIYKQVECMFTSFHQQLLAYEYRRFCQCKACTSAINLTLKVVTHYGEFTGYQVKNFQKLIGKDVIVAHQLLKNDIDQHEYWLVTETLVEDAPPRLENWMQWNNSVKQTETGVVSFRYTHLGRLKQQIKPEPVHDLNLSTKRKMFSLQQEYPVDIITLFHASGDFHYRSRWQTGVQKVEELTHLLPRVGMRCRSISEGGEETIYASSYSFSPERIEFSETAERDNSTVYYTLDKLAEDKTHLTIDYYIPKGFLHQLLFKLNKQQKLQSRWEQSLKQLDKLAKEIRLPA